MEQNETYQEKSSTLTVVFEYANESIAVAGRHEKDGEGVLNALSGTVYSKGAGAHEIGRFTGRRRGAAMYYDYSDIPNDMLMTVSQTVVAIEARITATTNNSQEGGAE